VLDVEPEIFWRGQWLPASLLGFEFLRARCIAEVVTRTRGYSIEGSVEGFICNVSFKKVHLSFEG
jgi:hypothetical protein